MCLTTPCPPSPLPAGPLPEAASWPSFFWTDLCPGLWASSCPLPWPPPDYPKSQIPAAIPLLKTPMTLHWSWEKIQLVNHNSFLHLKMSFLFGGVGAWCLAGSVSRACDS